MVLTYTNISKYTIYIFERTLVEAIYRFISMFDKLFKWTLYLARLFVMFLNWICQCVHVDFTSSFVIIFLHILKSSKCPQLGTLTLTLIKRAKCWSPVENGVLFLASFSWIGCPSSKQSFVAIEVQPGVGYITCMGIKYLSIPKLIPAWNLHIHHCKI